MFWRSVAGHDHLVHSVLTILALGGGPPELRRAFDDGVDIQRPMPAVDEDVVRSLSDSNEFRARMGQLDQYSNLLAFFARQVDAKGYRAVMNEYCFSRGRNSETLFAQLFEGLYHPIIHLAFGIEFDQPSIIAEALAQVASHDSMGIEEFLVHGEGMSHTFFKPGRPLDQLFCEAGTEPALRNAAHGFKTDQRVSARAFWEAQRGRLQR